MIIFKRDNRHNKIFKNGVSNLFVILMVSSIILEISIAGATIAISIGGSRAGERLSAEALAAARSGAQDIIMKVIREKDCPSSLPTQLTVGLRSSERRTCSRVGNEVTIESVGKALSRLRKVRVVLSVDSLSGEIKVKSFLGVSL